MSRTMNRRRARLTVDSPAGRRNLKRIGVVGAAALVASGVALPHASAAITFTVTMNALPAAVTVGQTETVTVIIANDPGGDPANLTTLTVNGACSDTAAPCTAGLPNVLTLGNGTGQAATGCAGVTFTTGAPDANGNQTVTPVTPVALAAGGTCNIDFSGTVTGVPAGGAANATAAATLSTGPTSATQTSASAYSVTQAATTLMTVPQPSSADVGTPISDLASLSGRQSGVNGNILFNLYGPGDATCAGPILYTRSVLAGASNGPYNSGHFTPTTAGTYNWVVSYSGDTNNTASASACGDESVTIGAGGGGGGTSTITECNANPLAPGYVPPLGYQLVLGTPHSDRIEGGSGSQIIFGMGGNDRIEGGSGDDIICGGDGNDRIEGGSGNDRISGGAGNDRISGGSGVDVIDAGGQPFDRVTPGSGD
jgi:hypothetical protein